MDMSNYKAYSVDSDDEEYEKCTQTNANPFHNVPEDAHQQELNAEEDAESRMNNMIISIQSKQAVPEYALSDAVFKVDRPDGAVLLGVELPVARLSDEHSVGSLLKLVVTEVYSPFQFWFQDDEDQLAVERMKNSMSDFYRSVDHRWKLKPFFIKTGYMCAVLYNNWQRARITSAPTTSTMTTSSDELVSVLLVDYGQRVKVPLENVYFLHESFMEQPAFVKRGTLADVFPLGLHWSNAATWEFRGLVCDCELHGAIKDVDLADSILFVSLWHSSDYQNPISNILINARLAGLSSNYSDEVRAEHNGRRLRYIREWLPSFDMLESDLFDSESEKFEDSFDDIIYNPRFLRDFEPPVVANPFRQGLQQALVDWLHKFKEIELKWRQLQKNRP